MKRAIIAGMLMAGIAPWPAFADDSSRSIPARRGTTEFVSGNGRALGSVTTIGGTTYYIGPDGATLATSTMVDGRKVFKAYD